MALVVKHSVLVMCLCSVSAVSKHHDQGNKVNQVFKWVAVQRVRVRDNGAKAWWHQQLRAHVLIHSREAERALRMA